MNARQLRLIHHTIQLQCLETLSQSASHGKRWIMGARNVRSARANTTCLNSQWHPHFRSRYDDTTALVCQCTYKASLSEWVFFRDSSVNTWKQPHSVQSNVHIWGTVRSILAYKIHSWPDYFSIMILYHIIFVVLIGHRLDDFNRPKLEDSLHVRYFHT